MRKNKEKVIRRTVCLIMAATLVAGNAPVNIRAAGASRNEAWQADDAADTAAENGSAVPGNTAETESRASGNTEETGMGVFGNNTETGSRASGSTEETGSGTSGNGTENESAGSNTESEDGSGMPNTGTGQGADNDEADDTPGDGSLDESGDSISVEESQECTEQPLNRITVPLELHYGETFDMTAYAEENLRQEGFDYSDELRITSYNTDKLKVDGNMIRAEGVTEDEMVTLGVRYLATEHLMESEEVEIPVMIHKVEPETRMWLQQNSSWQETQKIYIHEELAIHVSLIPETSDYGDLMRRDKNLKVKYRIIHEPSGSCKEYISAMAQHKDSFERTMDEIFDVGWQHFPKLRKGEQYRIEMAVIYTGTECPYILPAKQSCELTLEAANAYLETDNTMLEKDYRDAAGEQIVIPFKLMSKRLGLDCTVKEQQELEQICYRITTSDPVVITVDEEEEYKADEVTSIPVTIHGAGEATVQIQAVESPVYDIEDLTVKIVVKNNSMRAEDYYFQYTQDGEMRDFAPDSWAKFLEEKKHWLNAPVTIAITKEGRNYYDTIGCQNETVSSEYKNREKITLGKEKESIPMGDYSLWAEKENRNATTRGFGEEPHFQLGIDMEEPQLVEMKDNHSTRYLQTSNDKKWYFGKAFELSGVYEDQTSGIDRLEYSTDCGRSWQELPTKNDNDINVRRFSLRLENGTYSGIAVRAVDVAGNISEEYRLINKEKDYIEIVVDTRVPETEIQVSKNSQNAPTQGIQDWTNCALNYQAVERKDNPRIYKIYYQYVPIQQVSDKEQKGEEPYRNEDWKELTKKGLTVGAVDDSQEKVDRNGTYYFKSVSMCGLESEVVSKEIRLQQTLPDMMEAVVTNDRGEEWYNADSLMPTVTFPYEEYLTGCVTREEYHAPITIHRMITSAKGREEKTVTIGFTSRKEYEAYCKDDKDHTRAVYDSKVEELSVSFEKGCDDKYQLSYWIEDAAGNRSDIVTHPFNIDTTEPDSLQVWLDDSEYMTGVSDSIVYDTFSQNTIQGKASAQDNLSGIRSVRILKAKKFGEWKENSNLEAGENFVISPCTRCFLYVLAEDEAGNQAYTWTNGIIVDDKAPSGMNHTELVMEPAGANENGFYREDVLVDVTVRDLPEKDDYASLETVSCIIASGDNKESRILYQASASSISEEDLRKAETFQEKVLLDAAQYEGNDAYIEVTAKDKAGNMAVSTQLMKIDVTSPVVGITFDHMDAVNGSFYKEARTATIHIKELNFDEKLVDVEVTRNGEPYLLRPDAWTYLENEEYCASVVFAEDGDYTLSVKCKDMADNESETVTAEPFTIDRTIPAMEITYEGASAFRENYYNSARTAVVTIIEHNFTPDSFLVESSQEYTIEKWTNEGDLHQARLHFTQEGYYMWNCQYTDMAGNEAQAVERQEFYIDTKAPDITITGVKDNSANSGEVIPVVTVQDEYYNTEGVQIIIENGLGEKVSIRPEIQPVEGGYSYTLCDMNEQKDSIYYLTVICRDMAGNESTLSYRFSLNRNGSTYDMRQAKEVTSRTYYRSCDLMDMQIVEMNVDCVEKFSLYVSRNGVLMPSVQINDRKHAGSGAAYYRVNVQGDERSGYVYTYTLFKECFGEEGVYNVAFYSKDAAGNEVNNTLESKDAKLRFIVDNTPPEVVFDGIETDGVYDMEEKQVNVMFADNCRLEEAYLYLFNDKGEEMNSWNYMDLANDGTSLSVTIPEYSGKQSFVYLATDAAGNQLTIQSGSMDYPSNFVITTNPWVRFTRTDNVTGLVVCMACVLVCVGIVVTVVVLRRKRRIKE